MIFEGVSAPGEYRPAAYWEERARRFAGRRAGLAAVCSYGMPEFYNKAIDWEQRLALEPWFGAGANTRVLDVGCGVGRWSRLLAARGASVLGVDVSPTMIAEARRRAALDAVADRCRFTVHDLSTLQLAEQFDLVLAVTVLQHVLDTGSLEAAVRAMARHLDPGGRMLILEAAPCSAVDRCNSPVFTARRRDRYLEVVAASGLEVRALTGVDPAPFRTYLLPYVARMPRLLRLAALGAVTGLSLPINAILGRRWLTRSWHVVFVLEHADRKA